MKRLVVISGSEELRLTILAQLNELFDHTVRIDSYAMDRGIPEPIKNAAVLLTSHLILDECQPYLDANCDIIIARRTLNFACLDRLYSLPENSSILVVNDVRETTLEVIELLKRIGFKNYQYQAHYPGCPVPHRPYDHVIATRKFAHIPADATDIIEIGSRILDITSIVEVVKALDLINDEMQEKINLISTKYMNKIILLGSELHAKSENLKGVNEFLVRMINSVTDGILSYEASGVIRSINDLAAKLLDLREGANIFKQAKVHNKKLHAFLKEAALENCLFELNGTTYFISKIFNERDGNCLLTIKNVRDRINMENHLKKELKRQGYRAKYAFTDLVHTSQVMNDLIKKSIKLAESEFNIMIYGESGTGKEILASAIHAASRRKDGPFLAVNCSALPDELIESELFGYEEGAFTGAKKGGKIGLFELANQGTLFLDEIGDISAKIQSRLLRVLQEKEVLKVGGSRNIPVDVRIVAATNKDLAEMVRLGRFREDLYYRLKKLYVKIPPLRERREDIIPILMSFFIQKHGYDLKLTADARSLLVHYHWPGNVRELESCAEYILAVRESEVIDRSVLSEDLLQADPDRTEPRNRMIRVLLRSIQKANASQVLIGRRRITEIANKARFSLTEHQMRVVLEQLAAKGLLQMGRGKIGLRLTTEGQVYLGQDQERLVGARGGSAT